ncbi:MAG: hypothetical protein FJ100_02875 [Deltaproteobacteria bacterium]|nr:hypothetical protein [Deltaproteobacteria bacterium]
MCHLARLGRWLVLAVVGTAGCGLMDDPPVLDCAYAPLSQNELPPWLVQSCVLLASCSPFGSQSVGTCIRDAVPLSSVYFHCIQGAATCQDVEACQGAGRLPASACADKPKGWHCDGLRGVRCGFGEPTYVDCAKVGGTCALYKEAATAETWPCLLKKGACAADKHWRCDGTRQVFCSGTELWGQDCAATGQRCLQGSTGATCSPVSFPCSQNTCQGNTLHHCPWYGQPWGFRYDCAVAGGVCQDGMCRRKECAYGDTPCRERCLDGTRMQTCVGSRYAWEGGAPLTVDCAAYGFTGCARPVVKGVEGLPVCR